MQVFIHERIRSAEIRGETSYVGELYGGKWVVVELK